MKIPTNNPVLTARGLHDWLGWTSPTDFTLEEMAFALDVHVRELSCKSSEGRILIKGNSGIITVNSAINHPGKRNFVIAHELGHFLLHKNLIILFSDTHKTLSDWHQKGSHEQEANEFAAELLMPSELFKRKATGRNLNISLIEEVATYFQVSMTSAFLKYVVLGSFPLMVIYIESGIIRWKRCSDDFPFKYLAYNSSVPVWTVAGDYFYKHRLETSPEEVDAIEWFPEDYQIKYNKDLKLWEQCFKVSDQGLISCLWTR